MEDLGLKDIPFDPNLAARTWQPEMLFLCSDWIEYGVRPHNYMKTLNIQVAGSETRSRHVLFFLLSLFSSRTRRDVAVLVHGGLIRC